MFTSLDIKETANMQDAFEAKDLLLGKNKIEMRYSHYNIRFYMRSISYWKDVKYYKQLKKFLSANSYNIFYLKLSKDDNFAVLELKFTYPVDMQIALDKWKEYEKLALN